MKKIIIGSRESVLAMAQTKILQEYIEKNCPGISVEILAMKTTGDSILEKRLEMLERQGIPFEIVPGVSSALAVPTYFGIPATHRDLASSVHIVTGHRREGKKLQINFRALKEAGGTLIFLMGITALHDIVEGLLQAGMNPETPAAILQRGACGGQRKIAATLAALERAAKEQGVSMPAVVVVGDVVSLGEKFAWFEKLPLFGKRYLVTRPKGRSRELAVKLRELGAEVMELPSIAIRGIHPNPVLREELSRLAEYRYLVFTSPAGVAEFMTELFSMGKDVRCLGGILLAAIGGGTARALREYGLLADLVPEVYSGRALGALLARHCREGDRVLLARSDIGNPELLEELQKEKNIAAADVALYRTLIGEGGSVAEGMEENMDGVFFTSASTVRGFAAMFSGEDFSKVQALCIGEMTGREAERFGMQVKIAESADVDSLVELAKSVFV